MQVIVVFLVVTLGVDMISGAPGEGELVGDGERVLDGALDGVGLNVAVSYLKFAGLNCEAK